MTASPIIELCTMFLSEDAVGALTDVSGAPNEPNPGASAVGGASASGAVGEGGAPGGGDDGQDGAGGGGEGQPGNTEQPAKRSWRERLFGGEKAVEDVAAGAAEGLVIDGTLTAFGGGALGSVPMVISAGTVLAEGSVTIMQNEGRGLGGSSEGGKESAVEARRSPDGSYHPDDVAAGWGPGKRPGK